MEVMGRCAKLLGPCSWFMERVGAAILQLNQCRRQRCATLFSGMSINSLEAEEQRPCIGTESCQH